MYDITPQEWRDTVDACLFSYFVTTRSTLPHLISRGGGKVVNVCSVTPHVGAQLPAYSAAKVLGTDAVRATMLDAIPLERLGQPEDVAAAIAFLASSDADFISGADIVVDGAMIASTSWGTARTAWRTHDITATAPTTAERGAAHRTM